MKWKKWIPVGAIIALMITAYFLGVTDYLTFDTLKTQRLKIQQFVASHPITTPLLFMLIYAVSTALSLPGGAILTISAGFIFPFPWSVLYVVIGATIGAIAIFLAAKTAIGDLLKKKAGKTLAKMEAGFRRNAASYLLFLRLVVIFPFWLVNLAPAFFGVRLWTYTWTTFVGIIPGAFVFAQAGHGLGAIFDKGEAFTIDTVFNWQIKLALALIGLFALMPIVIKRFMKKK